MNKIKQVRQQCEEEFGKNFNSIKDVKLFFKQSQDKLIEAIIEELKGLELEFDVVVCDCGEQYKDTDPHNELKDFKKLLQDSIK